MADGNCEPTVYSPYFYFSCIPRHCPRIYVGFVFTLWYYIWDSWTLSPLTFMFPINITFNLEYITWTIEIKPVFSFELTGIELFETALVVQLVTTVFSLPEQAAQLAARSARDTMVMPSIDD